MRVIVVIAVAAACGGHPEPGARVANTYVAPPPAAAPPPPDAAPGPPVRMVTEPGASPDPAIDVGDRIPGMPPAVCTSAQLRADGFDLDGDHREDVRKVYAPGANGGEYLLCKLLDFDHDAQLDTAVLYDLTGAMIVEYFDFDFDGRTDAVTRHDPVSGLAITSRDTDGDGAIDVITAGPATRP